MALEAGIVGLPSSGKTTLFRALTHADAQGSGKEHVGMALIPDDRLDRLADAMGIAQRSRQIALQSVFAGIGLSVIAMIVAAFGYLPPVEGALIQEAIDVAVILNALRALRA